MKKKGIVKNISKDLGGIIYPLKVSFMSMNRNLYAQIKTNDIFLEEIVKAEQEVNSREYYYIPKKDVSSVENKIMSGSLIAITTSINGLDISHVGIAVKVNNRVHLLHAPVPGEKVQISKKPLFEYLAGNNKQTGIMVIAPLEP